MNEDAGSKVSRITIQCPSMNVVNQRHTTVSLFQPFECYCSQVLQSEKHCGSLSCEDLVMRIKLPGTDELEEIDLDVGKTYLKLVSSQ